MRTVTFGRLLTALAILGCCSSQASAATLCVEPTGAGGCHMTIQAAVDAAVTGDTIEIAAATYGEFVTIPAGTDNLIISAAGAIIDGTGLSGDALTILANGITIEGLTLQNLPDMGFVVGDDVMVIPSGTTLQGVRVFGANGDCVKLRGADTTLISGSTFSSCGSEAIDGTVGPDSAGSDGLTVEKSIMIFGDDGCIDLEGDDGRIVSSKFDFCEDDPCIDVVGNNAVVEGNKLSGCDGPAVDVDGDNAVVQKNKARNCDGTAIDVSGANPTVIKNKASFARGGVDVESDPCTGGTVTGNKASDLFSGFNPGIRSSCVNGVGGLLVEKNKVARAVGSCFSLEGAAITLSGNKAAICGGSPHLSAYEIAASQSTISGNSAKGAASHGFSIKGSDNAVSGNKSTGNTGSGFAISADVTGVVLTDNATSANHGGGYAVYDTATSVTLTGNASSDDLPYCKDDGGSTVIDGMGNSFSLAAPPICPPNL